jgi:hypothetical protein
MVSKRRFVGIPYLLRNMQRPVVVAAAWKNGIKFPRVDLDDEMAYILSVLKRWLQNAAH